MQRTRSLLLLFSAVALLSSAALPSGGGSVVHQTSRLGDGASARKPNIVLILTDDQRRGTFGTMPVTRRRIIDQGRRYLGIASTSLCCPVRTSLLSGNFSHTTGIYANLVRRHGGWGRFHRTGQERHTVATGLDQQGYRTGLFGKYINGWSKAGRGFVPPGWDVFRAFWFKDPSTSGSFYDYRLKGTGPSRWFGSDPSDYSTDVTADGAVRFIRRTPSSRPLFLMWTPYAPHLPATPAPRDVGSWSTSDPFRNRAVNEVRMADKQKFFQRLDPVSLSYIDWVQDQNMESLRAVDDGVRRIMKALGPRVHNTLFIYASDQGYLWGEHRMVTKYLPYRGATEYPLFLRWDGHIQRGVSHRLVPHVDIAATILQAGRALGSFAIDGRPILQTQRERVVLEGIHAPIESTYPRVGHAPYCGVRTRRYMYVDWSGDRKAELYDYRRDPLELHSVADHHGYRKVRHRLDAAAHSLCDPRPPGYHW